MSAKQARIAQLERYRQRLDQRLIDLQIQSDQFVRLRVAIVVIGAVLVFLAFSLLNDVAGYLSFIADLVIFNVAAHYHRQVKHSITRHRYWYRLKSTHLARIQLDWARLPTDKATASPEHPFAHDLDIVGEHSLQRLLDTTVSQSGSERLLSWLLAPEPDPVQIERRQLLVRELLRLTNFRDRLTLNGWLAANGPDDRIASQQILAWFQRPTTSGPRRGDLLLLAVLALINAVLFIGNALEMVPRVWPFTFLIYASYSVIRLRQLGDLFNESLSLSTALRHLGAVFGYLETYGYHASPRLKALCQPFITPSARPSTQLRRVGRVVFAAGLRGNPILWVLVNAAVPWDMFFGYLLARYRADLSTQMPVWLDTWYELEALSSLATFAYLNPDYQFPVIRTEGGLQADAVGHPLLDHTVKVCNDFSLTDIGSLVIITGSNMAGKSSFLRTLGVNLVLAYAGSVVNAAHFETTLFRVFSTIRINDSLTEGFSYFYAEVRRLKTLLNALQAEHPYQLFFLIDEIFKGTNNRERLIGSRAYIRALAGGHGLGVVSTHDLELVQLADEIPQVQNYHFREDVVDGRMIFDYKLRVGPCPTTNALKIMQMEGLPIADV